MTHCQFSGSDRERAMKRLILELAVPGAGEECGWSWLRKRESAVANYKVMSQNRGIDRLNQEASGMAMLWWVWPYVARQRILKGPNVRLLEKSSEILVLREALAWSWMVPSSNLVIGYDSNFSSLCSWSTELSSKLRTPSCTYSNSASESPRCSGRWFNARNLYRLSSRNCWHCWCGNLVCSLRKLNAYLGDSTCPCMLSVWN
jgi:hypothetical protein